MCVRLTGGTQVIGAAVAEKVYAAGHHLTILDTATPSVRMAHWIKTDLDDLANLEATVASLDGSFDALINNAGLPPRPGMAEMILRVNFAALKVVTLAMLDKLRQGAAIVNTASKAGAAWRSNLEEVKLLMACDPSTLDRFVIERALDPTRAYNLSKEAVIAFTVAETERLLARDLRMNAVSPAAVSTGILDDFATAFGARVARNIARLGRPGTPEAVADLIVFLAPPESGWIRGPGIAVDGGMGALKAVDELRLSDDR